MMRFFVHICVGILLSCADASKISKVINRGYNSTNYNGTNNGTASGNILRIQPLGNSITFGYLSTDGNGYRLGLLDLLTSAGNTVQYVGSVRAGNMSDNFNEGHPGAVISQIAEYAKLSISDDPNLVLLMAGTNDMNDLLNVTTAPDRLSALIDEITSSVPNVTVIVAQVTPAANTTVENAMVTFNSMIPGIVASKVSAGQKVSTVNMMDYVTVNDLADGLHPTDHGYQQMAKAWFAGIQEVQKKGWIDPPISTPNITNVIDSTIISNNAINATIAVTPPVRTALSTSTSSSTTSSSSSTSSKSASERQFIIPAIGTISLPALLGYFLYA
ncbi:f44d8cf0-313f-4415-b3f5-339262376cd2 [Sclerotinia trifoliorum]|uniref:F44d8cf0-313f-4415-b3f5-339262376cd2 n=1 Tax=Sclerotinia trifoliorum TaxID=28548 RepID=A0A8H2ZML9_9HELO|nr:f44d8cf0-313f-4415-b3f5-339262376cd2 [Sclerotinia trifoliorum]